MKKIISLFLISVICLAVKAQITITSADMPNAGDSLFVSITGEAASIAGPHPAETGAGYFWDYSKLQPLAQMSQEFDPPSKFPSIYSLLFNPLNTSYGKNNPVYSAFTLPGLKIDAAYDFFRKNNIAYTQAGVGYTVNNVPVPFVYKNKDTIYKFPVNYKNTDSCDFDFGLAVPGYGYYGQKGNRHNKVDGYGELKTPLATYTTLRVVSVINITDTVYVQSDSMGAAIKRPAQYQYKWLAAGSKIPVLQIDAIEVSGELVYTATFLDTLRKDVIHVGIGKQANETENWKIYPNPVQDKLTVSYDILTNSTMQFIITDVTGKELINYSEKVIAGKYQKIIDVAALPEGIYFFSVWKDHSLVYVKKLSVL